MRKIDKIGMMLVIACGIGLVITSAYGLIYCVMSLYLNHELVLIGILLTGISLTFATILCLSISDWVRKMCKHREEINWDMEI